ncbi:Ribosomal protein S4/S9, eukaryotic/archaeal [mine drainage metagenome]|uniref:30S ribosomal protein S4 n=1 Tax=mine drainage metagenome TaxID=410659 RepID=T1BJC5_9ZZZZ
MGDPKFLRRTYDTPKHPWEAGRMAEERKLLEKYGLKNKRELWKAQSNLRRIRGQARELQARLRAGEAQAQRETTLLLARLTRLGVLPVGNATIDDVLTLTTEDLLRRRFEWIIYHRNLAPTPRGARQWIVHGHFSIGDHRVTRPGYLVPSADEARIAYSPTSPLSDDDHTVRAALRERLNARPVAEAAPPVDGAPES